LDKVFGLDRQMRREVKPTLENQLVQRRHSLRLERNRSAHHGIQHNPQAPDIHRKPFIPPIRNNLWRKICRCPALVIDNLPLLYKLTDTEVTDFRRC
jgi:hypothetical protein